MKNKHIFYLTNCDKALIVRRKGTTKGLWELRVRAAEMWSVSQLLETSSCIPQSPLAVRAAETSFSAIFCVLS